MLDFQIKKSANHTDFWSLELRFGLEKRSRSLALEFIYEVLGLSKG